MTILSLSQRRNCSPTWRHEFQGTTPILGVHNPPGFLAAAFDIESENSLDLLHKFWTLLHFKGSELNKGEYTRELTRGVRGSRSRVSAGKIQKRARLGGYVTRAEPER